MTSKVTYNRVHIATSKMMMLDRESSEIVQGIVSVESIVQL